MTRTELATLLHDMAFGPASKPIEANRVFTSLRGSFGWAASMDCRRLDRSGASHRGPSDEGAPPSDAS